MTRELFQDKSPDCADSPEVEFVPHRQSRLGRNFIASQCYRPAPARTGHGCLLFSPFFDMQLHAWYVELTA